MGRRRGNNEGTVFQDKDGVWWAQLPPDDQGKRPKRRAATQREAQEKLRELVRQREKGVNLTTKQPTVEEFLQVWLDEVIKPQRKPCTHETYAQYVRLYTNPHLGAIKLNKLTSARIQSWVNELERKIASQTALNAYQRLNTGLEVAVRWRYISENPAAHVETPKPKRVPIRPLDALQAAAFLVVVQGHRLEMLYVLAIRLGMRQGELLGIRWKDVDLDKGVLRVAEQVQKLRNRQTVSVAPKTSKSIRELPLSAELVAQLRAHWCMLQEERSLADVRWKEYGLVFPSEVGTPILPRNLTRHFKASLRWAKLPLTTRFHDLRHSYAALSLAAGVELFTVSRRMGHSSISVTADRYGHLYKGRDDDAQALDKLLKRA